MCNYRKPLRLCVRKLELTQEIIGLVAGVYWHYFLHNSSLASDKELLKNHPSAKFDRINFFRYFHNNTEYRIDSKRKISHLFK